MKKKFEEAKERWQYFPWKTFIIYLILAFIGILAVLTASTTDITDLSIVNSYFFKQFTFDIGSIIAIFVIFSLPTKLFKNNRMIWLYCLVTAVLLGLVLIFGDEINGARAWFNFAGFGFQPMEFAKISLILLVAHRISKRQKEYCQSGFKVQFKSFLPVITVFGIYAFLLILQPDLGGIIILFSVLLLMYLASGVRMKYSVGLLAGIGGLSFVSLLLIKLTDGMSLPFLQGYQMARLTSFLDPFKYQATGGHQLINSYYALRLGGLKGAGVGNSIQKHGNLPEPHTDFILSIIGEETGFIGLTIVLSLFFYFIIHLYIKSEKMTDTQSQMIIYGFTSLLLVQSLVNLGGVTGLLPITGVTFPFISYGGSSTLSLAIALGITLNVMAENRRLNNKKIKR